MVTILVIFSSQFPAILTLVIFRHRSWCLPWSFSRRWSGILVTILVIFPGQFPAIFTLGIFWHRSWCLLWFFSRRWSGIFCVIFFIIILIFAVVILCCLYKSCVNKLLRDKISAFSCIRFPHIFCSFMLRCICTYNCFRWHSSRQQRGDQQTT